MKFLRSISFFIISIFINVHGTVSGSDFWHWSKDIPLPLHTSAPPSDAFGRSTIERTDGWQFVEAPARKTATVSQGPYPYNLMNNGSRGALLSELPEWNPWPEVGNLSIFPFLCENSSFGQFVRAYYKSSCAIFILR